MFADRRIARKVFAFVRPSARMTDARSSMREAFETWAFEQRASRERRIAEDIVVSAGIRVGIKPGGVLTLILLTHGRQCPLNIRTPPSRWP